MNKWLGMGRLTKDIELRYLPADNKPVCSFTLAVDKRFSKDKQADFINCQAWDKTAEFISKYFSKGSMIAVVGRLQNRSWEDKEGKKHYATEVIVEETYFTGEKRAENTTAQRSEGGVCEQCKLPLDQCECLPF